MPTLLQINATANWGSTGRIAEQLGNAVLSRGWNSYIAYGRMANPSSSELIKVGGKISVYRHYIENRLFDREGLASRNATTVLIKKIYQIHPDIIHLHNIHDHYLNYPLLFKYINETNIPIVWTQHDCWAFTGDCGHFDYIQCSRWLEGCGNCTYRHGKIDRTNYNYNLKKELFCNRTDFVLAPVSQWLANLVHESFLNKHQIIPIYNGIDVNIYKPCPIEGVKEKYNLGEGPILLAAATVWPRYKGLNDYIKLSRFLQKGEKIVLVGLPEKLSRDLPSNIVTIRRTQDVNEMSALYSLADIVLNLSYQETFGLTTVEGLACGTPSVVYNKTASPELIDNDTGAIVTSGDVEDVYNAIKKILNKGKQAYAISCRNRAVNLFNKDITNNKYLEIYTHLLKR